MPRLFVYGTLAPGCSPALGSEWARLDEFEGDGYLRVQAPVTLTSGRVVEAWLYEARTATD